MASVVFNTRIAAHQFADAIDADFGFPILGVRMGGGIHAPILQGRTARYGVVRKHPTLSQWSFPDDPVVVGKRPRVPLPGGASSQTLDSTWDPAAED
jgi:hypothetical protein